VKPGGGKSSNQIPQKTPAIVPGFFTSKTRWQRNKTAASYTELKNNNFLPMCGFPRQFVFFPPILLIYMIIKKKK
jgi:hypothetical protein